MKKLLFIAIIALSIGCTDATISGFISLGSTAINVIQVGN